MLKIKRMGLFLPSTYLLIPWAFPRMFCYVSSASHRMGNMPGKPVHCYTPSTWDTQKDEMYLADHFLRRSRPLLIVEFRSHENLKTANGLFSSKIACLSSCQMTYHCPPQSLISSLRHKPFEWFLFIDWREMRKKLDWSFDDDECYQRSVTAA